MKFGRHEVAYMIFNQEMVAAIRWWEAHKRRKRKWHLRLLSYFQGNYARCTELYYEIHPGCIGPQVIARCNCGGRLDVTDYGSW